MFTPDNKETETIDVMHEIWNGKPPENQAPISWGIRLDDQSAFQNVRLKAGETYLADAEFEDPDQDALTYKWELRRESTSTKEGGDKEYIPALIEGLINDTLSPEIELVAPKESGAYRLFVYAYDTDNNAAHANIPFFVGE